MNTNAANDLPCWAREALGHVGAPLAGETAPELRQLLGRQFFAWLAAELDYPEGRPHIWAGGFLERLAKRAAARWRDIEEDVLPPLAVLSDTGKCLFFRVMFGEGMRGAGDTPRAARRAVRRLDAICEEIAVKAVELADLLEQQAAIHEDGLAECDMPYLWELLLEAAAEYPVWEEVATSTEMHRFWTVAFGQNERGPELADVLRALVQRRRGGPFDSPLRARATEPAFRNREVSPADYVRILLDAIDEFPRRRANGPPRDDIWGGDAACLPADFALPDSALATLVSVVFDLPEGQPDPENVKARRVSWRKQLDADGLADTPGANRTAPPPAAPAPRPAPTNAATDLLTRRWSH